MWLHFLPSFFKIVFFEGQTPSVITQQWYFPCVVAVLVYDMNKAPTNLFNLVEKSFELGAMMSCSIEVIAKSVSFSWMKKSLAAFRILFFSKFFFSHKVFFFNKTQASAGQLESKLPNGLVMGHAYSVTAIKMVLSSDQSGSCTALWFLHRVFSSTCWRRIRREKYHVSDCGTRGAPQSGRVLSAMGTHVTSPHSLRIISLNIQFSSSSENSRSREWQFVPETVKKQLEVAFKEDGEFWYYSMLWISDRFMILSVLFYDLWFLYFFLLVNWLLFWSKLPFRFQRMSFPDILTNFDKLEICNLGPETMVSADPAFVRKHKVTWESNVFSGAWTRGVSAGGCRNFLGWILCLIRSIFSLAHFKRLNVLFFFQIFFQIFYRYIPLESTVPNHAAGDRRRGRTGLVYRGAHAEGPAKAQVARIGFAYCGICALHCTSFYFVLNLKKCLIPKNF